MGDPGRVPKPEAPLPPGGGEGDPALGLAEQLLQNPVCEAILESSAEFALILDQSRQVLSVNRELARELGLEDSGAARGRRLGDLLPGLRLPGPQPHPPAASCSHCGNVLALMASMEGERASREPQAPRDRLSLRHSGDFQVRSIPLRLAGQDLLLFTLQNITGRQRREALEQMFLHDILNLVEGMDGLASHLLDPSTRGERTAAQLRDLSRQLLEEVKSQRILLQAESGSLVAKPRETRPSEVLDRVRSVFAHHEVAEGRHLEIRHGPSGTFSTDPVLLTRVLVNLVKNAFEATPQGGTVRVWHEWRKGRRGFLVENPGLIPPQVAERIFERYHSTKAARGRGLGTYSARLLGERVLGGEVGFSFPERERTRFFVWLPDEGPRPRNPGEMEEVIFRDPRPFALEPSGRVGAEGGGTILVIDDSLTVRRLVGSILARDHRVMQAATGEEGLALALEFQPDLILLDVMMPGMDGFAVCTRLKADSRTREIPVVFLTALNGEVDEMRALEAGGIDFIPRPISPAVLCARVRNHLELKRTQDKLRNLSLMDGLTGIANRRRFDEYLEMEWQRCARSGQPLSVVMGDVDFFKHYNDGYGHGQGDECLRRVAQVFDQALRRPGDLAARYGGEEFVCVLPETDPEGVRIVTDQIMAGMEQLALPHAFSAVAPVVTVSLGVATAPLPASHGGWLGLVHEADRRLYEAKARGRNRVEGI